MQNEMAALEQGIVIKSQLTKCIISNLKKEAKRFLLLLAKYMSQKSNDGILNKVQKEINFQDFQQYCDLISKQFCGKIQELNEKITRTKLEINRLSVDLKSRPELQATDRIEKFKEKLQDFQLELQQIWKQQHFLVLNYRLDISAKELQRWTTILHANKINEDLIRENVENLFK